MGRRSYYDTDEERLPPGMTRICYDADTQVYTYRDSDGSLWEGAPGCMYGQLHRVAGPPPLPKATIPDNVVGDEQPYVLYDKDDDEDDDGDTDSAAYHYGGAGDEKQGILPITAPQKALLPVYDASPEKTPLSLSSAAPIPSPGPNIPIPFPTTAAVTTTTTTNNGTTTNNPPKRTGSKLSRLARLIMPSSSSSPTSPRRRATFGGSSTTTQQAAVLSLSSGRRPSSASSTTSSTTLRSATTFDEILGLTPIPDDAGYSSPYGVKEKEK